MIVAIIIFVVNGKPCEFLVDTGGGGTLIDISKKAKYGLEALGKRDYAAGIGSVSSLHRSVLSGLATRGQNRSSLFPCPYCLSATKGNRRCCRFQLLPCEI